MSENTNFKNCIIITPWVQTEPEKKEYTLKDLEEIEKKYFEELTKCHGSSDKYFYLIEDAELYKLRINPKTQKEYTWFDYCQEILGVKIIFDRHVPGELTVTYLVGGKENNQ